MSAETRFVVKNNHPGPDQNIYVFVATYDDIDNLDDTSRQENTAARLVTPKTPMSKKIEVSSSDDGAYYLALTFMAANDPGTGVSAVIYVGKEISNPTPSTSLIREIKIPEGFQTTLAVSPNGFSMFSELIN